MMRNFLVLISIDTKKIQYIERDEMNRMGLPEQLLEEAIAAQGGRALWQKINRLDIHLRMGGNLIASKFQSPQIRSLHLIVDTKKVYAEISPFPRPGLKGILDGFKVTIADQNDQIIASRDFSADAQGRIKRALIWGDLDLLYFLAYALWNYTMTPIFFTWPGFECSEVGEWQEDGEILRKLRVIFPTTIPTHSREQVFYFDKKGLLIRFDYTAYVFSSLARGVHYCLDHKNFNGLVFPTHRIVYWRKPSGRALKLFKAMEGWIDDVQIS